MKMNILKSLILVTLIVVGLSGCKKTKNENVANVDVSIKAIKNAQGVTVYAALHSVISYSVMKSVSVTSPSGVALQLTNFENGGVSFYNEPAVADYTVTPPASGTYTYLVKFNDGEEITYSNSLSAATLLPANITSLVKTASGDSLYITWDAIASTHAYQLKVTKGTTQVYFRPAFIDTSSPLKANLKVGFSLANLTSGIAGTYTFEVTGLLFESTAYDYVQAISIATKDIAL